MVYEDLSIDFGRTKFPPKSRYGVQTKLRALLEPAIILTQLLPVMSHIIFCLAFYDEYNLALAYEKPIFTNLVEFIAGGFKIDYSVMRASIINSIKFQLLAALGSDATKNVARFGFKKVLQFLPVTDHDDFYYMYVNYFNENKKK